MKRMSRMSQPTFWFSEPQPPQRQVNGEKLTHVCMLNDYGCINLTEVLELLPQGADVRDVRIMQEYNDGDSYWEAFLVKKVVTKNALYNAQLKAYERAKAEYDVAVKKHEEEMKQWEEQEKAIVNADLNKRLKEARALLKKHGELK